MKNALRIVTSIALAAIVISTSVFVIVDSNKANEEEKFSGWGNYDILSNVYPNYKSMKLQDNFYVGVMDQYYRNAANAPNQEAALEALAIDGSAGFMTDTVCKDMLASMDSDAVGRDFADKLKNAGTADDATATIMSYVNEIDAISSLGMMTSFIQSGGLANLTDAFAVENAVGDPSEPKAHVQIEIGENSFSMGGREITADQQANNIALFSYMLNKVGFSPAKAEQYKTDLTNIESALRPMLSHDTGTSFDSYTLIKDAYPILGDDLYAYKDEDTKFDVSNKDWMTALNGFYTAEGYQCLKALAMYNLLTDAAYYLDSGSFAFIAELTGVPYTWKDMMMRYSFDPSNPLTTYAGKSYCNRYVTQTYIDTTVSTIQAVKEAAKEYYNSLTWLSQGTKDNINLKFASMTIKFACPTAEQWAIFDYSGLTASGSLYEYIVKLRGCDELNKVSQCTISPSLFFLDGPPQTPNAEYSPSSNSISIYPGFAVSFIKDYSAVSQEYVYAKLVDVIGHEITHAFDDEGCNFDDHGTRSEGWLFKNDDKAKFNAKSENLKKYIGTHEYAKVNGRTVYLDGGKTIGEVMADMGGLAITEHMASKIQDFDYKAFYTEYAKANFRVMLDSVFYKEVLPDEHPSGMFRVNMTLQQSQRFHDTFNIMEGDGMFLSSENRATVWA